MVWKIKTVLDTIVVTAFVVSGYLVTNGQQTYGLILGAVATGIKAVSEYLYEKGVIVGVKK